MRRVGMVQGHGARGNGHRHAVIRTEPAVDALAEPDEMLGPGVLDMFDQAFLVSAGHHAHAARLAVRFGQRDPGCHMLCRREMEIVVVLVPDDVMAGLRLLDMHGEVVNEDVGADQVFDRVQHLRVMNDGIGPIEQQVGLRPLREIHLRAAAPFERLQAGPKCPDFRLAQHGHGADEAVVAITPDLFCGQFLRHRLRKLRLFRRSGSASLRRSRL